MLRSIVALAKSTHPVPSVGVTAIVVILEFGVGLDLSRLALLGLAILANQLSVGLSNDWLDAERDRAAGRTDKPVALGLVSVRLARTTAIILAGASIALTIPLGWPAALAHGVFLASGWAYNAWLKSTPFSVVPYITGFGSIPLIVTLALPEPALASVWAVVAGALLGVAAHFANVLPDLADDAATGVQGLPHRVGRSASGVIIAGALVGASASLILGLGASNPALYVAAAVSTVLALVFTVLVITRRASRAVFLLIIAVALIDVVVLAVSGAGVRG